MSGRASDKGSDEGQSGKSGWLVLGTLNEVVERLVDCVDLAAFWAEVCRSARWLVPGHRMTVVLYREADGAGSIVARQVKGDSLGVIDAPVMKLADPLGQVIYGPRGARPGFLDAASAAPGDRDALRDFLLADDAVGAQIMHVPLRNRRRTLGHMLWSMAPLEAVDRRMALASATSYGMQVGIVYGMLKANIDLRAVHADLEEKNAALQGAELKLTDQLALITAQHQRLRAMSTPIIAVAPSVLACPVVGVVDAERAARMIEVLLDAVARSRARAIIVDLTGVDADEDVSGFLIKLVDAVRLLGAACVLTGISPALAQALAARLPARATIPIFATMESALRRVTRETA